MRLIIRRYKQLLSSTEGYHVFGYRFGTYWLSICSNPFKIVNYNLDCTIITFRGRILPYCPMKNTIRKSIARSSSDPIQVIFCRWGLIGTGIYHDNSTLRTHRMCILV